MSAAEARIRQLEAKLHQAIGVLTVWEQLAAQDINLHPEAIRDLAVELRRAAEPALAEESRNDR